MRSRLALGLSLLLALATGPKAEARLLHLQVLSVRAPTFDGASFGPVGRYEEITAHFVIGLDPRDPHNAGIVDLARAPTDAAGLVEASGDLEILRPMDLHAGNGVLLYDVLNRGNKVGLWLLNDAPTTNDPHTAADSGNGYLMRRGYTVVWSAWQFDAPARAPSLALTVPVVPGIAGRSREEFIFDNTKNPAIASLTYPAADLDPAHATLTVREKETDARAVPAGLSFRFVDPMQVEITRPTGYDAGAIYELIYTAKDPVVAGMAFAAVRDVVSFLLHDAADMAGNSNPLLEDGALPDQIAYGYGISQSGRFLRDFLYRGFNQDEAGRQVFAGLMPHVAGTRRTFVDFRWAQPGRFTRQHEDHVYPDDQFPFTYGVLHDLISDRTDGLLRVCLSEQDCPKIIQTDSDTEPYQAHLSLLITDPEGHDIQLPANVRAYYLAGLPHFSPGTVAATWPSCRFLFNPLAAGPAERALLADLNDWVKEGVTPPPSQEPSVAAGTWVRPQPDVFPAIPALDYSGLVSPLNLLDTTKLPPEKGVPYPVFVPKVNGDGIAVAGVHIPPVAVPRATYMGWNHRRAGYAPGELCSIIGSTIALSATPADAERSHDARVPLSVRYPTEADYVAAVRRAADALVRQRLLLPEDAERAVEAAEAGTLAQLPKQ